MTERKRVRVLAPMGKGSRTQQSFRDEANINKIVAKYNVRRFMQPRPEMETVGEIITNDFYNMPDFHTMQTIIARANENFMRLPAKIRSRFDNDPQKLLDFVKDPKNEKEGIALGIYPEPQKQPQKEEKQGAEGTPAQSAS